MVDTNDMEYIINREKFIDCIKRNEFPWEAAYYYYVETSEEIDIFPFEDFKQSVWNKNQSHTTYDVFGNVVSDGYEKVTIPIYEKLDEFYNPIVLLSANDEILKVY